MDTALLVLQRTPLWVWILLALTLGFGVSSLRASARSPLRLALVPLTFLGVALWFLLSAPRGGAALAAWGAGAVTGGAIGALWAGRLPIAFDRAGGMIQLPGSAFWLVTGLILFGLRYAIGIHLGFNAALRNEPFWILLPQAVAGFGTGMAMGWLGFIEGRYLLGK